MYIPFCDYRCMNNHYTPICEDSPQRLIKALEGEQDAIKYYNKLITKATENQDKDIISEIISDEKKHFGYFKRLYFEITGYVPQIEPSKEPNISNYIEGLEKAIMDETDAYEFYRDNYLCFSNDMAKERFLEAFTDENQHAVRLNYLFTKAIRSNK